MPPHTTKTIGPLHLEDLSPSRFEDLIRQLAYDFRPWRMLEATGRAGSDDGFDARGFEMVGPQPAPSDDDDADEPEVETVPDRLWLIQCKREREIGPSKLVGYLDAIPSAERPQLHGIVFAAACDFSKRARDDFHAKAREFGLAEAHLWGKAEIEDQLFQAKNDHLLFAYFGFSLQVRRRTLKTDVRARLATKRKCKKYLTPGLPVLLRDASDERYPWLDPDEERPRLERGKWRVMRVEGTFHDGVRLVHRRHVAFVDDDGERWDCAQWANEAAFSAHQDPWGPADDEQWRVHGAAHALWMDLPEPNRAWFQVVVVLPFESILDVDAEGDDRFGGPHIYTLPFEDRPPFRPYYYSSVRGVGPYGQSCRADDEKRVERFPREQPDPVELAEHPTESFYARPGDGDA